MNSEFEDIIFKWGLTFKLPGIEKKYQAQAEIEVHRKKVLFWVSVISIVGSIVTGLVIYNHSEKAEYDLMWGAINGLLISLVGLFVEILANLFSYTKFLRGLSISVAGPLCCIVYSFRIFSGPCIFFGDMATIIGSVLCNIIFSYNWVFATVNQAASFFATSGYVIYYYSGKLRIEDFFQTIGYQCLLAIFLPFYFYYKESEKRATYYANWKIQKEKKFWNKVADKLSVGIMIGKESTLIYSNPAVGEWLSIDGPLDQKLGAIKEGIQKILLFSSEDASLERYFLSPVESLEETKEAKFSYKAGNDTEKHFAINLTNLKKGKENYKLCIIQDKKTLEDLEYERMRNQYQKTFLAMITHELRNPLHGIMGTLEIIQDSLTSEEMLHQCKLGLNTGKMMMSLVNDLLDISQLEANRLSLAEEEVDIVATTHECMEIMNFQYAKKQLYLKLSLLSDIPIITSDRRRFSQILINLLSNAYKFTGAGGVTIRLNYEKDLDLLVTTIADTGKGIAQDNLSKLFTMYERLNTTAVNSQGVGLGLVVCKKLSEQMGGYIKVESEIDQGTTFEFAIKNKSKTGVYCYEDLKSHCGRSSSHHQSRRKSCRKKEDSAYMSPLLAPVVEEGSQEILIIDDDFGSSNVLKALCNLCNVRVDTASSGEEGIRMVENKLAKNDNEPPYKLIFLDIHMTGINGLETAKHILKLYNPRSLACAIVGLSGDSGEALKQECTHVGMQDLLAKPFGKANVQMAINRYLHKR